MTPKILIAEDESFIRLLIEQSLEDIEVQGVTLLSVDNGQDALDLALRELPDLIFLDINMPIMGGMEVCEKLRQALHDQVFIVILSAKGQEVDRQRGAQVGADLYLTKPFDPDQLVDLASQVLNL